MGVDPSFVTRLLALALVVFVGVASAILLWDGLAGVAPGGGAAAPRSWRTRARVVIGVIGFALAFWIVLGMLTRAR